MGSGSSFLSPPAGPHPRREPTLMRRLGLSSCPRLRMAAGAHAAHTQRRDDFIGTESSAAYERHGLGVIISFTAGGAPPPPGTDSDASPRTLIMSSTPHGRRRSCRPHPAARRFHRDRVERRLRAPWARGHHFFHRRRGPTPAGNRL